MDMKDETLLLLQRITEQYGSVNRLAKELGIPQSTLNSILNHGIETARFETAAAIYAKLGVPLPMEPLTGRTGSARGAEVQRAG